MTWFKVDDSFDSHPKVLDIPRGTPRLRATGLWSMLGAWCARNLTDGVFAAHMVDEYGAAKADAGHLLRVRLWEPLDDGRLQFHDWTDWNPSREQVLAERKAAADRQKRARERAKESRKSPGGHGVTHGGVTPTVTVPPTRPDPSLTAAAAAVPADDLAAAAASVAHSDLPPAVEILRRRLDAAKLVVRWDKLTAEQLDTITALVELHGDERLVKHAVGAYQPNRPIAFAQGWLGGWEALPAPGTPLQAVADPACPEAGHSGSTRHCAQCASERLAGDR